MVFLFYFSVQPVVQAKSKITDLILAHFDFISYPDKQNLTQSPNYNMGSCACKFKYLPSLTVESEFFLLFEKKMGRSGDGKRDILLGWPCQQTLKYGHVEI